MSNESSKNWKDYKITIGSLVAFLIAIYPAWAWLDANVIVTPAQAAQSYAQLNASINQAKLRQAREAIAFYNAEISRIKYRNDLSESQREEMNGPNYAQLRIWQQIEKCVLAGGNNC